MSEPRALRKLRTLLDNVQQEGCVTTDSGERLFWYVRQVIEAKSLRKKFLHAGLICDLIVHTRLDRKQYSQVLARAAYLWSDAVGDDFPAALSRVVDFRQALAETAAILTDHGLSDFVIREPALVRQLVVAVLDEVKEKPISCSDPVFDVDGNIRKEHLSKLGIQNELGFLIEVEIRERVTSTGLQLFVFGATLLPASRLNKNSGGNIVILSPLSYGRCSDCGSVAIEKLSKEAARCQQCGRTHVVKWFRSKDE